MTWKLSYDKFLASAFWLELSASKKAASGCCDRCGSKEFLECHHRFYRSNWFDTKIEDLECLCHDCHENEHSQNLHPRIPATKKLIESNSVGWKARKQAERKRKQDASAAWQLELGKRTQTKAKLKLEADELIEAHGKSSDNFRRSLSDVCWQRIVRY